MKTKELFMGEKQATLKLWKEGTSIRATAQTVGIANMTISNVPKTEEPAGVLSSRYRTGQSRTATAIDDRNNYKSTETADLQKKINPE